MNIPPFFTHIRRWEIFLVSSGELITLNQARTQMIEGLSLQLSQWSELRIFAAWRSPLVVNKLCYSKHLLRFLPQQIDDLPFQNDQCRTQELVSIENIELREIVTPIMPMKLIALPYVRHIHSILFRGPMENIHLHCQWFRIMELMDHLVFQTLLLPYHFLRAIMLLESQDQSSLVL
ncbi:hypothetical protein SLA2020_032270 [Shorea laevis]